MGKAGPKPPLLGIAVTTTALQAFNAPQQDVSIPNKVLKHQLSCLGILYLHQQLLKRAKKATGLTVQFLIKTRFLAGTEKAKKLKKQSTVGQPRHEHKKNSIGEALRSSLYIFHVISMTQSRTLIRACFTHHCPCPVLGYQPITACLLVTIPH